MATTLRCTARQFLGKKKFVSRFLIARQNSSNVGPNILTSTFKEYPNIKSTVNDFVWQNLDRWPDKTATVCAVTGHGYTYEQTYKMSVTFAASLRTKLKLVEDDKVAVILPNIPEYPCTVFGLLQAGCVGALMNPVYTTYELKRQFEITDCKAIVTTKLSYPSIKEALNILQKDIPIILIENENLPEGTIKFAEFAEDFHVDIDCLKSVRRGHKDTAFIPFSSGTTGFPKGVVLTHDSVVNFNQMIIDPDIIAVKKNYETEQSVSIAALPFFHIFGLNTVMINLLHLGCKLVTMATFNAEVFLKSIVKHQSDVLFLVPPMVLFLGKHPAVTAAHLQSLTGIISGAAPVAEHEAAALLQKNKNLVFRQGFGLTETNGGFTVGTNKNTNHASVGKVFAKCQVKIADVTTHEALGPGKDGEIWFRGPSLMQGYYKNEEATKEVMTEDGWFKTGDIGRYDEDQYLYVTDRLKELIKVKGFQVPPAELEMILRSHPQVQECVVLGMPDEISGEAPKALIVPHPNQTIDKEAIKEYVNSKVATFKKIKDVQIIDYIPKNATGKPIRKELREKYC